MREHEANEIASLMHIAEKIPMVHPHLHHIRNRALKRLEELNAGLAEDPPVSTVKVPGQVPEGTQVATPPAQPGEPVPPESTTVTEPGAPGPTVQNTDPSYPPASVPAEVPQTSNTAALATGTPAAPAAEPPPPAQPAPAAPELEAPATPLRRIN